MHLKNACVECINSYDFIVIKPYLPAITATVVTEAPKGETVEVECEVY